MGKQLKVEEKAMVREPAPGAEATLANHDALNAREGDKLKAVAQARQGRRKAGMNPTDISRIVRALSEGVEWPKAKALAFLVDDAVLEAWKESLFHMAQHPGGERQMPEKIEPKK